VREAGKTYANAVGEVREAADFLRYYAAQIRDWSNDTHKFLGIVACISPWNFPLSIFTGQIAGALAAGNGVVAKPAEETPRIAAQAVTLFRDAGLPADVLELVIGDAKIGAGVIHRKNDASAATPKSDLVYLGAAYPVTPLFILDGELAQLKFMDSANKARLFALRGTYLFSKRTALYATAGRIANDGTLALSASGAAAGGNPAAGTSQLGFATGIRHSF